MSMIFSISAIVAYALVLSLPAGKDKGLKNFLIGFALGCTTFAGLFLLIEIAQ